LRKPRKSTTFAPWKGKWNVHFRVGISPSRTDTVLFCI